MVIATYRVVPRITVPNSDMVFVGYGINAPARGWNEYAGVDVTWKTVVILVNDPDWENAGRDGPFDGRGLTDYGRWTSKYHDAARQSATGATPIPQTPPASYG